MDAPGALMRHRPIPYAAVLACALLTLSLAWSRTNARPRGARLAQPQSGVLGPGIQLLLADQLPRQELRKLVTDSRTLREHPDLAAYYRNKAEGLKLEAQEYVRYMRAAGDRKPLDQPNHYFSRTARFDYLAAKDKLKQAREADILAALNAQAEQAEGCFTCHSLHGHGGKIGPDLAIERSRNRSDAWLVQHFKDPQAYSRNSAMPSFAGLTSGQLETLARFLQYQKEDR